MFMKILKNFIGAIMVVLIAMSFLMVSCQKEDQIVESSNSKQDCVESSRTIISNNFFVNSCFQSLTYSDPCSGAGGNSIPMRGNRVLSAGKHIISLTMSQNSYWTYGFSSLLHQYSASSNHTGDVYWRVVKRRQNFGWGNDDYEVYKDCSLLTQGESESFHCTTADINTGGQTWTHIQLEIVVVGGSASVAWTSYNKSPWS